MKNHEPSTSQKNRAASRIVFVRLPSDLYPQLIAAHASPSSLARLAYATRKAYAVLHILESLATGASISAGCRKAGVHTVTGWRWHQQFLDGGVAGFLPRTHRSGRRAKAPALRARGVTVPVQIVLNDLRVRSGNVAFRASARPVLSPAARRANLRAVRNIERSLPAALRTIMESPEVRS